jgi:hypothetical protein
MIDPAATEGAVIGQNLRWSDGTRVQEGDVRNTDGGGSGTPVDGGVVTSPTLWSLIVGIPEFIKSLAALTGAGEGIVVKRPSDAAATFDITAADQRVIVTDGGAQAGNPMIGIADWPITKDHITSSESWIIPAGFQLTVHEAFNIEGELDVEGDLFIQGDSPGAPEPTGPSFTYVNGDVSQIDYDGGEQKLFTYNVGGDLEQVDFIQDGLTLRKEFVYTGGGDLDYVNEYYV